MSGASYLTPSAVTRIRAAVLNGQATKAALLGTEPLVLARWNEATQSYTTIAAQAVVVTYANRAEEQARGEAAMATMVDGYFSREVPFSVETGDLFALGEMAGEITIVLPPQMGIQRAGWKLRAGETA